MPPVGFEPAINFFINFKPPATPQIYGILYYQTWIRNCNKHFIVQLMHINYKIPRLLKQLKL